MGRPLKPTALKILTGNPGKRPLNMDEPKPASGAEMPASLADDAAVAHWRKWAPVLTRIGVLTEVDAMAFGRLCRRWAEEEARAKMVHPETGLRLPADPRLDSEIRQLEERFGMNPSSRAKLKALPADAPKSKMEKFRVG